MACWGQRRFSGPRHAWLPWYGAEEDDVSDLFALGQVRRLDGFWGGTRC
jgi:hypothetical protein